ncbi:endoribonuclease MazF [Limnohabitans sp.]|uniref:endoribonuclease MazF n=1 Tax=Limnohabitans sp. TaxID=1907725 RepID=UPI003341E3D4
MARAYVPDTGEVVWLEFDPQAGHEQAGHRPALVISPASYNGKTGLMLCCPMSTKVKGHPFEVLTHVDGVACAVLSDQVKSLDWRVRRAKKKAVVNEEVLVHVKAKMKALTTSIVSKRSDRVAM